MVCTPRKIREESGIALIVTILLLLMISAIGLTALQHAGDEAQSGSSSRRKITTLYAADAAMKMMQDQLLNGMGPFPDLTPLDNPALFTNEMGSPIAVHSGTPASPVAQSPLRVGATRSEGTQLNVNSSNATAYGVAQSPLRVGATRSEVTQLNVNSSNATAYGVYRVGIVANDTLGPNSPGSQTHLQAQFTVHEGAAGY